MLGLLDFFFFYLINEFYTFLVTFYSTNKNKLMIFMWKHVKPKTSRTPNTITFSTRMIISFFNFAFFLSLIYFLKALKILNMSFMHLGDSIFVIFCQKATLLAPWWIHYFPGRKMRVAEDLWLLFLRRRLCMSISIWIP